MDIHWAAWYEKFSVGHALLKATSHPDSDWSAGLGVESDTSKMQELYLSPKLPISQCLTLEVLMAHHAATGKMGVKKMEDEIKGKYHLCTVRSLRHVLEEVR